jgi:integrase
MRALAQQYERERLPARKDTARVYRCWLKHVLRYWGERTVTDVQPREMELWLRSLDLSPKSKGHVRGVLHVLLEFAMWSGLLGMTRNPVSLVRVEGVTKRIRRPRSLTIEEFKTLRACLKDPFRLMATVCASLGLRISECLALRWQDIDWLGASVKIERGIVNQIIDNVKTDGSGRPLSIADELLEQLKLWRQITEFATNEDWIFASPIKLGRLPYSYTGFWRELDRAGKESGLGHVGTHTFRHSFRSWLDAVGTPVAVQQKLMRHSDIRTTMNVYGDVITDEMETATAKVAELALRSAS